MDNNYSAEYLRDLLLIVVKLLIKGDKVAYDLVLNRVDRDENYCGQKGVCHIKTLEYARKLL